MKVVVAGSHGLIGSALTQRLATEGHEVYRLVRATGSPAGRAPGSAASHQGDIADIAWDPDAGTLDPDALDGADAVVNLGGAGLGDHRWTSSYRSTLRESRLRGTALIARTVAELPEPPVLLQASAMGVYGDRGDALLPETAPAARGFLPDLVRDWESATLPASVAGARVVLLRTSIVLSHGGGALGRLLPLIRLGLGGPIGSGRQYWSWITLEDHVSGCVRMLTGDVDGAVNMASPDPVRCTELVRALAKELRRPALLKVPRPALRVAIGEFAGDLLTSARLEPVVLESCGFEFAHPTIADAAAWVVAGATAREGDDDVTAPR
jgi:hypothetical protein